LEAWLRGDHVVVGFGCSSGVAGFDRDIAKARLVEHQQDFLGEVEVDLRLALLFPRDLPAPALQASRR